MKEHRFSYALRYICHIVSVFLFPCSTTQLLLADDLNLCHYSNDTHLLRSVIKLCKLGRLDNDDQIRYSLWIRMIYKLF